MDSSEQLSLQAERLFHFVSQSGFTLVNRQVFHPESFKGGFALNFVSERTSLRLEYSDMEFQVHVGENEVFGPSLHPSFAGNMFSREHLVEHMPAIAERVKEWFSKNAAGSA